MKANLLNNYLPAALAAVAWILGGFGGVYCKFVAFPASGPSGQGALDFNFGIWYYQGWETASNPVQGDFVLETCVNYPNGTSVDSKWMAARAFVIIGLVTGGVTTFWSMFARCFYPTKPQFKCGAMLLLFTCLCQGLTLLALTSSGLCTDNKILGTISSSSSRISLPDTCSMAAGAKCTIASTVFWFAAALAALRAEPMERDQITTQTHDVTYTKTLGADGTEVVSENVVRGEPIPIRGGNGNLDEPLLGTLGEINV